MISFFEGEWEDISGKCHLHVSIKDNKASLYFSFGNYTTASSFEDCINLLDNRFTVELYDGDHVAHVYKAGDNKIKFIIGAKHPLPRPDLLHPLFGKNFTLFRVEDKYNYD